MAGWLLDTNIISALMRPEPRVVEQIALVPEGDLMLMSVISHAEVRHGLLRTPQGRRRRTLERAYDQLLAFPISIVDITEGVGESYAQLRFVLEQRGIPRADNDLWIAATALYHDLTLVTDDSHFNAVLALQVVNWLREPSA